MSLRRLVLFWGKRTCLYSRHASRCIMAAIVSGLRWSASSLSAEEYNFNWPQLVSCRAGGARFLLWVIKGCAKITCCYIGVGENCNILYTTCSPSHYKIDTCGAFFLWTRWHALTALILCVTSDSVFQPYGCLVWSSEAKSILLCKYSHGAVLGHKDNCAEVARNY